MRGKRISSLRVVVTSFLVDVSDITLNLIVALASGSAVMLVQALQGGADLITSGLLIIGVRRSQRIADNQHHFGYGREIYFWTLISALMMLTITSTFSFYNGWQQFFNPEPVEATGWALLVLVLGFVTNSYALYLSVQRLRGGRHNRSSKARESILSTFNSSVLVETKATFILDTMGVSSAILGFVALSLYAVTGNVQFDGIGAMLIGLVTAFLAVMLVVDVKDLLVGRSVGPDVHQLIADTATAVKGVDAVLDLRTMYIGSEQLLVNMELDIDPKLKTEQIERLMDIIKAEVKDKVPTVHHIQIELETPERKRNYVRKYV